MKPHLLILFAWLALLPLPTLAAEKIVPLGHGYARQGKHVLFDGKRIDREGRLSFSLFRDKIGDPGQRIAGAPHAPSFKALSVEYAKDKYMVYHRIISPGRFWVVELPAADVATFEVVGSNLAKDKNAVWWYGKEMAGPDSATLQLVNDGYVWKDAKAVWYQHKQIIGADPASFRHLGSGYYADKKHVYWSTDPIPKADPATFKVLGGDSFIGTDGKRVFRSGQQMPNLEAASVCLHLHADYGYQILSDQHGVYLNQQKFLHGDPKDVNVIDDLTVRSRDAVLLVDTFHLTPVTVLLDKGELIATTVLTERDTKEPLAMVEATIDMKTKTLGPPKWSPAPGAGGVMREVPKWQQDLFFRPDLVARMVKAGEILVPPKEVPAKEPTETQP